MNIIANYTNEQNIRDMNRLLLMENALRRLLCLMDTEEREDSCGKDMDFLRASVSTDICRKCPRYRDCYGQEKEDTLREFASILREARETYRVDGRTASETFRKKCVYFHAVVEEISWIFRLIYQNAFWENRYREMQEEMKRQLSGQIRFLACCREQIRKGSRISGTKKIRLYLLFLRNGIRLLEGEERKDERGQLEISVVVRPLWGKKQTETVKKCLDRFYGENFLPEGTRRWLAPGTHWLNFSQENSFHVLFGRKCENKSGESINGDTFSFTNFGAKRAVMLLSDGMGTGEDAFFDSKKMIEALEDFLEMGISEEFALEMIQNALLFKDTGRYSTIDVGVISLQTGMLKILKAGGPATFLCRRGRVERIEGKALPPGCRADQKFDVIYKKLYDGDMVVMVSDGMLEFENMPQSSLTMETVLKKITTNNAQSFAEKVMRETPVPAGGYDDDRTVLVASVWEKGRKYG